MNRHLMMSAAALLAGTGAAGAGTSQTIYFNGSCPAIELVKQGNTFNATFLGSCSKPDGYGMGFAAKTKGIGKNVNLSDNFEAMNYGVYTEYVSYDLSLPLRNGGAWAMWLGFSGTSIFEANSGTYRLHASPNAGGQAAARTKALIAARKGYPERSPKAANADGTKLPETGGINHKIAKGLIARSRFQRPGD